MTREDLIHLIRNAIAIGADIAFTNEEGEEIIKALEQEPCEDDISRQAVEKITWEEPSYTDALNVLTEVRDKVRALPSVTSQPKTGHWIEKDMFDGDVAYECSVCGEPFCLIDGTPTDNMYNFCPNCGAKMIEPQESKAESDHKCHTCKHYTSGEKDGSCGSYICKGYSNWESEVE